MSTKQEMQESRMLSDEFGQVIRQALEERVSDSEPVFKPREEFVAAIRLASLIDNARPDKAKVPLYGLEFGFSRTNSQDEIRARQKSQLTEAISQIVNPTMGLIR
jgi:hypothetical protein